MKTDLIGKSAEYVLASFGGYEWTRGVIRMVWITDGKAWVLWEHAESGHMYSVRADRLKMTSLADEGDIQ